MPTQTIDPVSEALVDLVNSGQRAVVTIAGAVIVGSISDEGNGALNIGGVDIHWDEVLSARPAAFDRALLAPGPEPLTRYELLTIAKHLDSAGVADRDSASRELDRLRDRLEALATASIDTDPREGRMRFARVSDRVEPALRRLVDGGDVDDAHRRIQDALEDLCPAGVIGALLELADRALSRPRTPESVREAEQHLRALVTAEDDFRWIPAPPALTGARRALEDIARNTRCSWAGRRAIGALELGQ